MLCQMCKIREATTTRLIKFGDVPIETYLCDDCAKRVASKNVFNEKYNDNFWSDEKIEIRCEKCKTTISDFEETLYVGCENCYKVFASEIAKKALQINGKNVYVGKIPPKLINKISRSSEINQLSKKLDSALAQGQVMEANRIRAKIYSIGGDKR